MNIITWIARILTGTLFIFSGLIKANDPYGFAYKLDEYFEIFHMPIFVPFTVGISIVICILEVLMGFWLLIGYKPVLNAWALLLLIVFFDFLTGYTALANFAKENPESAMGSFMGWLMNTEPKFINSLSDCGCFGDFIKLKPYQSFWKDVVLTIFIAIIFIRRRHLTPLTNPTVSAVGSFTVGFIAVAFPIYCYMFLPSKDFLPYKVGNDIVEQMNTPPNAPTDSFFMTFIYKNKQTGEVKKYTDVNNLPDSNWVYQDREQVLIREGYHPPIHDFKLFDADGNEFTDIITEQDGYKLIYVMKDMGKVNGAQLKTLESLSKAVKSKHSDINIFALTSTDFTQINALKKEYGINFNFYACDNTVLKSMVRSNPGVLLLKKSTVLKKWSSFAIPSAETVEKILNKK
jgi:uncharacterized membrane protein YphA (DoxX/SURF4 family)